MGSKKLSVLLSFVLVLGLLLGACSSDKPVDDKAGEAAAEVSNVAEEAAAGAETSAESVAADASAAMQIVLDEAGEASDEVKAAAEAMVANAQSAVEAAAAGGEASAEEVVAAMESVVADAQAAVEAVAADGGATAEEVAAAMESVVAAAQEKVAETVATDAEATAEEAEVEEVATGVKPENLYKAEDDDSFDSISWSMGASDIPTLDPALATDTSSNQIIQLVFMGLTMQNEETGDVMNAIATDMKKSDVAEDGSITYTYTLRNDIPWVRWNAETEEVEPVVDCDGNVRFLTAHDYEYAIKRAADPATASDYAFMVTDYVKGGAAFFAGEEGTSRDDVAVKALDDVTLEITWVAEFAANNMIAGLWTYVAVPSWVIDGDEACDLEPAADLWATIENINTYGPYAAKEWVHDDSFTVIKNPYWPADVEGIPQAQIEEVVFRILDSSAALAEFEAGNLTGVNDIPTSELDRIKADPELSKTLSIGEDMCTYYYGFNTTAKFMDDARVRRALSMAIDRKSIVENVTKAGQVPAQWFSRPGLVGAPTLEEYPDLGIKYDPETAKDLLEDYMKDKGIKDPMDITIEIVHNTSENHAKIAVAIQQMWKDTLGIDAIVSNQEWAVYLKSIRSKDTPQVYRMGWCQDYMDAASFLNDDISSGGSQNPTVDGLAGSEPTGGLMWYNEEYEKLIDEAQTLSETADRLKLYADAEQILVYDDAAMAPLYWYTRPQLSSTDVNRTYSILGGKENFYKWSMK